MESGLVPYYFEQMNGLATEISRLLGFSSPNENLVNYDILDRHADDGFDRQLIEYSGEDSDRIGAYLFVPQGRGPFPAVLVLHQHNSQWHLGKSEVAGIAGDPLNGFGPVLARKGCVVLAPDSIGFEDRRAHIRGIEPHDKDWLNYYNGMAHRLVSGKLLLTKVLNESATAISLLLSHPQVLTNRVGILGHSYGGSTAIFHAALDERICFVCASGAACSFARKIKSGTGLEMSLVIPGFYSRWDIPDLIACFGSRPTLLVSAEEDPYSEDANEIVVEVNRRLSDVGVPNLLEHSRYPGGHALTQQRFDQIVSWVCARAAGL